MSTETKNNLQRNLSVLFSTTIIPVVIVLWVGYQITDFEPIPWLTLIIGSVFGITVAIIVNSKSEKVLSALKKSDEDKNKFAKFILISNFKQLQKLSEKYFETINETSSSTKEKKNVLKTIIPSITSFMNICEISLPNVGNLLTQENIEEINSRFILLHKLIILLESGSDKIFENNINNLDKYTKNTLKYLEEI